MFSLKEWLLTIIGGAVGCALFAVLFSFGVSPVLLVFSGLALTLTGYFCLALGGWKYLFDWRCLLAQSVGLGLVLEFCILGILGKF